MKTALPIVVHSEPNKPPPEPTHLAITVEPDPVAVADDPNTLKKKVTVFVNGNQFCEGTADRYSPPDGAPLFIGVKNNESDPYSNPPVPRHPVLSPIQEVVLYEKVLSPADIKKHYDIGIGKGA
jgi:hypothetical protein